MNGPDIVSREKWEARAPKGMHRRMSSYEGFVVHHSAGPQPNDGAVTVRAIQRLHQDDPKFDFIDIGYNFLIDASGTIFQGRPVLETGDLARGAHAPGVNSTHVGICLLGCFHPKEAGCDDMPAVGQLDSLVALCRHLTVRYWMRSPELAGHRDHRATDCPGDVLFGQLDAIRDRIAGEYTLTLDRPTVP